MRNRPRALHGDGHLHKMHKRGENVPSARVCVRVCARVVCTYYSTYRAAEGAEWGCCCNRPGCRGIERLAVKLCKNLLSDNPNKPLLEHTDRCKSLKAIAWIGIARSDD